MIMLHTNLPRLQAGTLYAASGIAWCERSFVARGIFHSNLTFW